jgi:hypothetical protein
MLTNLLLAGDAREAASRTISWVKDATGAHACTMWLVDGKGLRVRLSLGLDQESIERATDCWKRHRAALRNGTAVEHEGAHYFPIESEGLLYILAIEAPSKEIPPEAVAFARSAISALKHSATPSPATARMSVQDLQREELRSLLESNEWNIARVARLKGKTRKTLYSWLAKLGIQRERVSRA